MSERSIRRLAIWASLSLPEATARSRASSPSAHSICSPRCRASRSAPACSLRSLAISVCTASAAASCAASRCRVTRAARARCFSASAVAAFSRASLSSARVVAASTARCASRRRSRDRAAVPVSSRGGDRGIEAAQVDREGALVAAAQRPGRQIPVVAALLAVHRDQLAAVPIGLRIVGDIDHGQVQQAQPGFEHRRQAVELEGADVLGDRLVFLERHHHDDVFRRPPGNVAQDLRPVRGSVRACSSNRRCRPARGAVSARSMRTNSKSG